MSLLLADFPKNYEILNIIESNFLHEICETHDSQKNMVCYDCGEDICVECAYETHP